jgi:predicted secreted protein
MNGCNLNTITYEIIRNLRNKKGEESEKTNRSKELETNSKNRNIRDRSIKTFKKGYRPRSNW